MELLCEGRLRYRIGAIRSRARAAGGSQRPEDDRPKNIARDFGIDVLMIFPTPVSWFSWWACGCVLCSMAAPAGFWLSQPVEAHRRTLVSRQISRSLPARAKFLEQAAPKAHQGRHQAVRHSGHGTFERIGLMLSTPCVSSEGS